MIINKKTRVRIITAEIKIFRKTDIVLIAVFLIFAGMFYFIFNLSPADSENDLTVIIKLNGKLYEEIALDKEKIEIEVEVYSDNGVLLNIIKIKDKKAFVIYANCPDKLCLNHKPVEADSYTNNIIICLPNRVTVEIKNKNNKFDAVI